MIPSLACPPWRADLPGPSGEQGDQRRQLHHAPGHDLDPAELERYRSANEHRFAGTRKETVPPLRPETHPETALRAELDMVRAQLAMMRELTAAETRRAESAEAQRDAWQKQAEQVRLIADQREKRLGWFGWLKAA